MLIFLLSLVAFAAVFLLLNYIRIFRLNQKQEKKIEDLLRSNRELEKFAYLVSHDLKEPIRTITTYLGLFSEIQTSQLSNSETKYLHFALEASEQLGRLIDSLLNYSRLGKNNELVVISANEIVGKAVHNLKSLIEKSGARITYEPLPTIKAESMQIIQLFQNLISNSIKFKKHAGECLITITSELKDDFVEFCIEDNGIGIEPKEVEKVFDLFFRGHNKTLYPGEGIGLAACKKIVENHKGKIWIESLQNVGTKVRFTLPQP